MRGAGAFGAAAAAQPGEGASATSARGLAVFQTFDGMFCGMSLGMWQNGDQSGVPSGFPWNRRKAAETPAKTPDLTTQTIIQISTPDKQPTLTRTLT